MHLLRAKAAELSFLMRGLTFAMGNETFCASNGLADRMRLFSKHHDRPLFHLVHEDVDFVLEVAAMGPFWLKRGFREGAPKTIDSWCNGERTAEHGSHVDGVLAAFAQQAWWPESLAVAVVFGRPEYAGPTRGFLRVPGLRKRIADVVEERLARFVDEHVEERP